MKKFFAIRYKDGTSQVIHDEWDRMKHMVLHHSGVIYKGFYNEEQAHEWLLNVSVSHRTSETPYFSDHIYLFTDGSCAAGLEKVSWAWVAVCNNQNIAEDNGWQIFHSSRNIAGEIEAVIQAVLWFVEHYRDEKVTVVYDYEGIPLWLQGIWNANSEVALKLVEKISPHKHRIMWEKVEGHTGIFWNEYVDKLAYQAYLKIER